MKKLFLLFLGTAALNACKKEDTTSRAYLLTAKNWRVSAATSTNIVNGQPVITDSYATYPACDRDDFLKFNSDNSVVRDQGSFKCNSSSTQISTGNWYFNDAQTQLTCSPLGYITGDIIELSATTLHIRLNPSPYYNAGSAPNPTNDIIYTAF